jgi:hypothetical protein
MTGTGRSRAGGGGGGGCGRRASRGRGASRCPPPTRARRLTAPARGRASPSPRIWSSRSMGSSEGDLFLGFFLPFLAFCHYPVLFILLLSLINELELNSPSQVSSSNFESSPRIIRRYYVRQCSGYRLVCEVKFAIFILLCR